MFRTLLLCLAACLPLFAHGQTDPIRIGFLTVRSGALAAGGKQMEEGIQLYLKERNYTLAGRKVELIIADTGGRSMWGSACARWPPTVATLRTRTLASVRSLRAITGQPFRTISDFSIVRREVIAPTRSSPPGPVRMPARSSLPRLTRRDGRSTPAFIISIRAVPPEIGRTEGSFASSDAIASRSDRGSASSNGITLVSF